MEYVNDYNLHSHNLRNFAAVQQGYYEQDSYAGPSSDTEHFSVSPSSTRRPLDHRVQQSPHHAHEGPLVQEASQTGTATRSNAIAKLKRAASQREMRTKSPGPNLDEFALPAENLSPHVGSETDGQGAAISFRGEEYEDVDPVRAGFRDQVPPIPESLTPSPLPNLRGHSPMHALSSEGGTSLGVPVSRAGGNRSPLPSLEQLRARILQERGAAGLARSASTSAAARQYAMEKLLGASMREGAISPVSDTAEEQEDDAKRTSVVKAERVALRRSRTIGGLSATAEAQRKAAFVKALDEGVPDDLRNLRRSSRRFAHDPPGRDARKAGEPSSPLASLPETTLDRNVSQRQHARTEMLRKLSTRRGARSPAKALDDPQVQPERTTGEDDGVPVESPFENQTVPTKAATVDPSIILSNQVAVSPPVTPLSVDPAPITPSPNVQSRLLTVPRSTSVARTPSTHSSAMGVHEEERNRASAMARLYGEEAFEYERLLEMGYSTDDAFERVASARSGSYIDNSSVVSPRSLQGDFQQEVEQVPSTPVLSSTTSKHAKGSAFGMLFQSPGAAPVNVSPTHVSHPNTVQMRQDEWVSKHPSEASIPLGFDANVVRDDNRSEERNSAGDGPRQTSITSLKAGMYPESVIAASSTSISSTNHDSLSKSAGLPLLSIPPIGQGVPLERIEDLLTPGFLRDVGNPLDYSHSPVRSPNIQHGSLEHRDSLSESGSSHGGHQEDGGAQGDYLNGVDKMAKQLERFARKSKRTQRDEAVQYSSAAQVQAAASDVARQVADASVSGIHSSARLTPIPLEDEVALSDQEATMATEDRSPNPLSAWKTNGTEDNSPYSSNEKLAPFPGLLTSQQGKDTQGTKVVKRKPSPLVSSALEAEAATAVKAAPEAEKTDSLESTTTSVAVPKETFFSSLRRKASRKGLAPTTIVADATSVHGNGQEPELESPTASRKLTSFLNRKASGKGSSSTTNAQRKGVTAVPSEHVKEEEGEKEDASIALPVANAAESLVSPAVRALAGQSSHSRNLSTSSVGTSHFQEDLSLALDSGRANQAPMLAAPAALAPATAAVLQRYSRVLTAPNESVDLPDIPGLSAEQMGNPPRQFIMAAPVLQVVTSSTVKDRYLFLFSDLVIFAKPVRGPTKGAVDVHAMPTLAWTFSVKSILSLDEVKLTLPKGERRQNVAITPLMSTFASEFRHGPRAALESVIRESGLPNEPTTMAKLLQQTPDLDRAALSGFLFDKANGQAMRAFVYQEKFAGVSIESALRSLLLELRFPPQIEPLKEMLVTFGQQWTETNRGLIKDNFTGRLAIDLIMSIMSLNDALHSHHTATPGYFQRSAPEYSKEDFIRDFRHRDPGMILSDRTLLRIYGSVSADAIQQAPQANEDHLLNVRILAPGVPTRIVYGQPSEPIRIAIPQADPGFAIRLYGQSLTFQPQVLSFEKSHVQEFRVLSKSLGPHSIVFIRTGPKARFYQSIFHQLGEDFPLPRSINISVQRAFMQNCFTLTLSGTRRFMVSVEDEAKRKTWLRAIKDRLEKKGKAAEATARTAAATKGSANALAMHVLRETLIQPEGSQNALLQRSASIASPLGTILPSKPNYGALARNPSDSRALLHPLHGIGAAAMGLTNPAQGPMNRQESISRHYYGAKGMGHSERDLIGGGGGEQQQPSDGQPPPFNAALPNLTADKAKGPTAESLTGEELILTVKQNSLLSLVIAHAQNNPISTTMTGTANGMATSRLGPSKAYPTSRFHNMV